MLESWGLTGVLKQVRESGTRHQSSEERRDGVLPSTLNIAGVDLLVVILARMDWIMLQPFLLLAFGLIG